MSRFASAEDGKKTGDGHGVGFFIPLSAELAEQYPSLGDDDHSPPHTTFLYIGQVLPEQEPLLLKAAKEALADMNGPVTGTISPLDYFTHPDKERRVAITPIKFNTDMAGLRWKLRDKLLEAGFQVDDSFPLVYSPHATLEYLEGLNTPFAKPVPEGQWQFDEIEIWGLPAMHAIPIGSVSLTQRVASRHVAEGSHKKSMALVKFLSDLTRRLGVAKHVYVVGGAVRNFILDEPIKDIDMVIDSIALGKGRDADWLGKKVQRAIPAQINYTYTDYKVALLKVMSDWFVDGENLLGEDIEIATARLEEYEKGGYKPKNVFPTTIDKDVYRREFTFNTLLWRMHDLANGPDKAEILDLTGCGRKDLDEGWMKCPSDPDETFDKDPSRMIRVVKFLVKYGFKVSPEVKAAVRRQKSKVKNIPPSHLSQMLIKIFFEGGIGKKALIELEKLGLLEEIKKIAQTNKSFRNALANWADKKADLELLFDMMDLGMPTGQRLKFIKAPERARLREITVQMGADEADAFVGLLEKPGKIPGMNMGGLIKEFGLKGGEIQKLTAVIRETLLDDPVLAANGRKLTERVQQVYGQARTAKTFELKVGDPVLIGKYLNSKGRIESFKKGPKGDPMVVVRMNPKKEGDKGAKKEVKLFKLRYDEAREKKAGQLPKVHQYVRFDEPGVEIELFHLERDGVHYLAHFDTGSGLSFDIDAKGSKAQVEKQYEIAFAKVKHGVALFTSGGLLLTEEMDTVAKGHLKLLQDPEWGIQDWGNAGDAPDPELAEQADFHPILVKQLRDWKGSSNNLNVTRHPYWPTFHKMFLEAAKKKYGSKVRVYRGIHGKQAVAVLGGKPLTLYPYSSWAKDLDAAMSYRGQLREDHWVVVRAEFNLKEIALAPVVLPDYAPDSDVLLPLARDVYHSGDELVVGPRKSLSRFKVVRKTRKQGGVFKGPPAMRETIREWMLGVYCGHVLARVEWKLEVAGDRLGPARAALKEMEQVKRDFQGEVQRLKLGQKFQFKRYALDSEQMVTSELVGVRVSDSFSYSPESGAAQFRTEGLTGYEIGLGKKRITFKRKSLHNLNSFKDVAYYLNSYLEGDIRRLSQAIREFTGTHKEDDTSLVGLNLMRSECLKYTRTAKEYSTTAKKVFPIDLTGWKYLSETGFSVKEATTKLNAEGWGRINCILDFKGHATRGGMWLPSERQLEVDVHHQKPHDMGELEKGILQIKGVARHEVQHAGQSYLRVLRGLKEVLGLPGDELRNPHYPDPFNQEQPHALRDVEFYPRLEDDVEEFLSHLKKTPKPDWLKTFKLWVNGNISTQSDYFSYLKGERNKAKWRKAIKEFQKRVEEELGEPIARVSYMQAKPSPLRGQTQFVGYLDVAADFGPARPKQANQLLGKDFQSSLNEFREAMKDFEGSDQEYDYKYDKGVWSAWHNFYPVAQEWGEYVVEHLEIPPKAAKSVEMAVRLFSKNYRFRGPQNIPKWFHTNEKRFKLLELALRWPERSEGGGKFRHGPFTVHNTTQAGPEEVETALNIIDRAMVSLRRTGVPAFPKMAYGDLYLVGQIKRKSWAWYAPDKDIVYLRPNVGSLTDRDSAEHLVHELGHRLWRKSLNREVKASWAEYHKRATTFPTPYADTNAEENFCESLALKAFGKLKGEHLEAFNNIVLEKQGLAEMRLASRVADRYLARQGSPHQFGMFSVPEGSVPYLIDAEDRPKAATRIASRHLEARGFTKIVMFDFDGTLFKSQETPPDWWDKPGLYSWGMDPVSLSHPCVPERPSAAYWDQKALTAAKRASSDPDIFVVLITGRVATVKKRVFELLKQQGIRPNQAYFNDGVQASLYKKRVLGHLLTMWPEVSQIQIWENENIDVYSKWVDTISAHLGRKIEVIQHPVRDKPIPVACRPEDLQARVATRYLEAKSVREWMVWMAQPFAVIWKHHKEFVQGPVDDAVDAIIKELAPKIVKALGEHEVDSDVEEFLAGAQLGQEAKRRNGDATLRDKSEWEKAGYGWGYAHSKDFGGDRLPAEIRSQVVQNALREFGHKVTEKVVIDLLKKVWHAVNPVNTVKAIISAVKKHGWKLGVGFALFEAFEHLLLPGILAALTGNPKMLGLASLPIGEVVYAVIFRILGRAPKELDEADEDGHLDWYEAKYGPVKIASLRSAYNPNNPPFGPNTPLMNMPDVKVKYRVKSNTQSILVGVYYGRKKIAAMSANVSYYPERDDKCGPDVLKLAEKYPQVRGKSTLRGLKVFKAFIFEESKDKRGLGIGKAMYEAVMADWFDHNGPFLFMPMACAKGSGTSPDARRVWASLAKKYPSSGEVIAVLRRPRLPAQMKAASRHQEAQVQVAYIGVLLDPMDTKRLTKRYGQEHPIRHAHHMTVWHGHEAAEMPQNLPWGKTVTVKVVGEVKDAKGQAVLVAPPTKLRPQGVLPHITISTVPGVTPAYSKKLLQGELGPETGHPAVSGKVAWVDGKGDVHLEPPPAGVGRIQRYSQEARIAARYQKKKEVPKADGKGTTTVYEYSERQIADRNRDKAKKVENLRGKIGDVRKKYKADLTSSDEKTRFTALAVGLMDDTFERVGNEASAKEGHVGVTGWQVKHLTFSGGKATIKYVGKSGVSHEKVVSNSALVSALKKSVKGKKPEGRLCEGDDCKVEASDVNDYLKSFDITAKDVRGFHANSEMQTRLKAIRAAGGKLPTDQKKKEAKLKAEFDKALKETADAVGHEAATLRSQYLVPGMEDEYLKDGQVTEKLDKSARRKFATKTHTEKEDEEAERLSRPAPKNKPPRYDLRRERVRIDGEDPDQDKEKPEKKAHRVARRWVRRLAQEEEHKPGTVWETDSGWSGKNQKGDDRPFKGDTAKEQAEAFSKGKGKPDAKPEPEPDRAQLLEDAVRSIEPAKLKEGLKQWNALLKKGGSLHGWDAEQPIPSSMALWFKKFKIPELAKVFVGQPMGEMYNFLQDKKLHKLVGKPKPKPKPKPKSKEPETPAPEPDIPEPKKEKKPKEPKAPEDIPKPEAPEELPGEDEVVPEDKDETAPPEAPEKPDASETPDVPEEAENPEAPVAPAPKKKVPKKKVLPEDAEEETDPKKPKPKPKMDWESAEIKDELDKLLKDLEMDDRDVVDSFEKQSPEKRQEVMNAYQDRRGDIDKIKEGFAENGYPDSLVESAANALADPGGGNSTQARGRRLADLYYAKHMIANPKVVGGKAVNNEVKSDEQITERAEESFGQYQRGDKDLREEVYKQLDADLHNVDEDSPEQAELQAIKRGLDLASDMAGDDIRGRTPPPDGYSALTEALEESGNLGLLLQPMDKRYGPEGRKVFADALDTVTDKDLNKIMGGSDGVWGPIIEAMGEDGLDPSVKEWAKGFLKRQAVNEMTSLHGLFTVSKEDKDKEEKEEKGEARGTAIPESRYADVRKLMKAAKKLVKKNSKNKKTIRNLVSCAFKSGGSAEGVEQCQKLGDEAELANIQAYLEALEAQIGKLDATDPLVAQLEDVIDSGDLSRLGQEVRAPGEKKSTKRS